MREELPQDPSNTPLPDPEWQKKMQDGLASSTMSLAGVLEGLGIRFADDAAPDRYLDAREANEEPLDACLGARHR